MSVRGLPESIRTGNATKRFYSGNMREGSLVGRRGWVLERWESQESLLLFTV